MEIRRHLRSRIYVAAATLVMTSACHHNSPSRPDHPRAWPGVRVQDVSFHSVALNRDMPYRVYFPETIAPGQKLPVVYLLHGGNGGFRDWSNYSDVGKYAERGLILVMPEGAFSYYMNAVERPADRYQDYILNDLVSDVESRFPAARDRGRRALIGISMGGFAAINYAFAHSDMFAFAAAFSPPVEVVRRRFNIKRWGEWWRIRSVFGPFGSQTRRSRDPFALVESADPARTSYIYLGAGASEPLHGPVSAFAAHLRERHFAFEFHTLPGGHDWGEWDSQIPGCFESLLLHLDPAVPR